jgi:pimeloyl-ACP methyl ester carboxylesterase
MLPMVEPARRVVVFLPGGVTPVALSYAPLLDELAAEIDPVLKDLEVYAAAGPPDDYSVVSEVEALRRTVDDAHLDTFHLVGYSGGGAVSLSFAARYPQRLKSLALFEPANVPGAWDEDERGSWRDFNAAMADVPPEQMLGEFTRLQVRPGVELPSARPGPPPDWMASRPSGLRAMMSAFAADDTDRAWLRRCHFPVYLGYGLLTEEFMVHRVQVLAALLPDIWIEAYPGVHHFGPPQRTQPAHFADALRLLWSRAERNESRPTPDGDTTYAA